VITRDEAERIATKWVSDSAPAGASLTALVNEFDLGYVVSARSEPGSPPLFGSGRGIIDKETGEFSVWPSLPVESVIARYRAQQADRPPTQWTWHPAAQARWDLGHVATPSTVTHLRFPDRRLTARSVLGDDPPNHHRLVAQFHADLPSERRERGYDRCSEAAAISDALHAEDARRQTAGEPPITVEQARTELFGGVSIVTYRVREPGDPVAGESAPPCISCALLCRHFGFQLIPPAGIGATGEAADNA
jgi:YwqJ-like deaminase